MNTAKFLRTAFYRSPPVTASAYAKSFSLSTVIVLLLTGTPDSEEVNTLKTNKHKNENETLAITIKTGN